MRGTADLLVAQADLVRGAAGIEDLIVGYQAKVLEEAWGSIGGICLYSAQIRACRERYRETFDNIYETRKHD